MWRTPLRVFAPRNDITVDFLLKISMMHTTLLTVTIRLSSRNSSVCLVQTELSLYLDSHKAVVVAVDVEVASAVELETGLGIAFGIELDELHCVGCQKCHKGNKM